MKCPSCGKENPAGEQYCLDCGTELAAKPAAAAGSTAGSAGTAAASGAGAASLAMSDAEFQQLLHSPPTPATCPHCGAAAPAGGTFCDNCGEPLTGGATPAAGTAAAGSTPAAQPADAVVNAGQPAVPSDSAAPAPVAPIDATSQPPVEAAATAAGATPAPPATPPAIFGVTFEIGGPAASSTYAMSGAEVKVGRRDPDAGIYPELDFDGNDVVVDGGERVHAVSRRHGRIFRDGDLLKYEDLGSTNGSTLNGAPVLANDPQTLKDGDKIVLGRTCRIAVHMTP